MASDKEKYKEKKRGSEKSDQQPDRSGAGNAESKTKASKTKVEKVAGFIAEAEGIDVKKTREARKNIKDTAHKGSVVADAFAPLSEEIPPKLAVQISTLIDMEPRSKHGEKAMQDELVSTIEESIKYKLISPKEGVKALTVTASIYAENPEAAREIMARIRHLEETKVISREQIMEVAPEAVRQVGVVAQNEGVTRDQGRLVAGVFNEMYGNADPSRVDAPDLMAAFEEGFRPPLITADKDDDDELIKGRETVVDEEPRDELGDREVYAAEADNSPTEETDPGVYTKEVGSKVVYEARADATQDVPSGEEPAPELDALIAEVKDSPKELRDTLDSLAEQVPIEVETLTNYQEAVDAVVEENNLDTQRELKSSTQRLYSELPADGSADALFVQVQAATLKRLSPDSGADVDALLKGLENKDIRVVKKQLLVLETAFSENAVASPALLTLSAHSIDIFVPDARPETREIATRAMDDDIDLKKVADAKNKMAEKMGESKDPVVTNIDLNSLGNSVLRQAEKTINAGRENPVSPQDIVEAGLALGAGGAPDADPTDDLFSLPWPDEADRPKKYDKNGKLVSTTSDYQTLQLLVGSRILKYANNPGEIGELMREVEGARKRGLLTLAQSEAVRDRLVILQANARANQDFQRELGRLTPQQQVEHSRSTDLDRMWDKTTNELREILGEDLVLQDVVVRRSIEKALNASTPAQIERQLQEIESRVDDLVNPRIEASDVARGLQVSKLTLRPEDQVALDIIYQALNERKQIAVTNGGTLPSMDPQVQITKTAVENAQSSASVVLQHKYVREVVNGALHKAKDRNEMRKYIDNLKRRRDKLIRDGVWVAGGAEDAEVNLAVNIMHRRAALYEVTSRSTENAMREYEKLGEDARDIFGRKNSKSEYIISSPRVQDLISAAMNTNTQSVMQEKIRKLQDEVKHMSGDESVLVRQILVRLERQAELLDLAVTQDQLQDYHFRQAGLESEDVRRLQEITDAGRLVDRLMRETQVEQSAEFDEVWDGILHSVNKVLQRADSTPLLSFDQSITPFVEEPVLREIATQILRARQNYLEHIQGHKDHRIQVEVYVVDERTKMMKKEKMGLEKGLDLLYKRVVSEREIREFTHNINYIIQTRGSMEDISKFASRLRMETLFNVMLGEKESLVQHGIRIYEMELQKLLADNNWINPTRLNMDKLMREQLKAYAGKDPKENWKVDRATTLSRGIVLGVTAGLDWLAQAQPPRGHIGYAGYAADAVLGQYNMTTHFVQRWWAGIQYDKDGNFAPADSRARWFYLALEKAGSGRWQHDKWVQQFMRHAHDTRTNLHQTPDGYDIPFLQISNFFKIGSFIYRQGWRNNAALRHHFIAKRGPGTNNELLFPADDRINWGVLDVTKTWDSMSQAGYGVLYWFTDQLKEGKVFMENKPFSIVTFDSNGKRVRKEYTYITSTTHHHQTTDRLSVTVYDYKGNAVLVPATTIEGSTLETELKKDVMSLTLERNPMKFIRLDPTMPHGRQEREARNSIRMQALARLGYTGKTGLHGMDKQVHQWERDCHVITTYLIDKGKWNLSSLSSEDKKELRKMLGLNGLGKMNKGEKRTNRFEDAVKYWEAVQGVVRGGYFVGNWASKEYRGRDLPWLTLFAKMKLPYGLGSEDLNYNHVRFEEAGESLVARAAGDNFRIVENAVIPMMEIHNLMAHAAATHSYDGLVEFLHKSEEAIKSVHGEHAAEEVAFKLSEMIIRYFDKDWQAQLPFGVGTMLGTVRPTFDANSAISFSQEAGVAAWAWDEQTTRAFIDALVLNKVLPRTSTLPHMKGVMHYDAQRLYAETGARKRQVALDIGRSWVPLAMFLLLLAAYKNTEDDLKH